MLLSCPRSQLDVYLKNYTTTKGVCHQYRKRGTLLLLFHYRGLRTYPCHRTSNEDPTPYDIYNKTLHNIKISGEFVCINIQYGIYRYHVLMTYLSVRSSDSQNTAQ